MVSGSIDHFRGFILSSEDESESIPDDMERPEKKEARDILEYSAQRKGYWDNAQQVGHEDCSSEISLQSLQSLAL
jgi:hypothetical protein